MDHGYGVETDKTKGRSQEEQQEEKQTGLNMRQEIFEETVSRPVKMSQLDKELIISFMDFSGECEVKTCPGDIYKIVNALMDYSRLLEMVITEWELTGYHQAVYEIHAEQLRKIANKFSAGIGYNYYEALEKCRKRQERQQKKGSSDVGEEALALTVNRGRQPAKKKQDQQKDKR